MREEESSKLKKVGCTAQKLKEVCVFSVWNGTLGTGETGLRVGESSGSQAWSCRREKNAALWSVSILLVP